MLAESLPDGISRNVKGTESYRADQRYNCATVINQAESISKRLLELIASSGFLFIRLCDFARINIRITERPQSPMSAQRQPGPVHS